MVSTISPPPIDVPAVLLKDKTMQAFFGALINIINQLWTATYSIRIKSKVLTTDASVTAVLRVPIPEGRTIMITANIVARRTGGAAAGSVGDSAWYQLAGCYKNIGGVLTGVGTPSLSGGEDVAAWNVGFSSLANEALVTVLGAIATNITWITTVSTYEVGA